MAGHEGHRTQAERDAITVEIGYALFSAAFAAAVLFGAVAGPALLFALPDTLEKLLPRAGSVIAAVVFLARVVSVLIRFRTEGTAVRTEAKSGDGNGRSADGETETDRRGGHPGPAGTAS
ncbi:DUF6332 family protein [Streptomyces sp. NPDC048737]|uniref:DUF6332 family protein n=1 Tax=unclassified Streptomyces TaxID=2593676 RepID=UPI0034471079